ncbi:MAG: plasmid pRiA4b ORF-3 family protein [Spirochaetaceae bacterium]|jgi:hypothetical protein|nr:plasmid pRiA4b ORF-3 family protein [Spirochaetaceae bacterium]
MTQVQEDALYEYLLERREPFLLKDVTATVRAQDSSNFGRLSAEISRLIKENRLAFNIGSNRWITRAGCFTGSKFVINPTKDELVNGILIPGHRFIPFASPIRMQKEYTCLWKGKEIPFIDTEASPDDLYPYYSIFGDEFSPQLIARESPQNEAAYNADPYEEPLEVSIKTFDMRSFYRESLFVPGDNLVLTLIDWRNSVFEVEHIPASRWDKDELVKWFTIAESGFRMSFEKVGPNCTIEEQVAWAFFYGGIRMRTVPAYSLESFLYEKTDKIETVPFGIESRFWFAGKEIPDFTKLEGIQTQSDQTPIEKILLHNDIPISEYVIQSYVYDALFRKDTEVSAIVDRIVPPSIRMRSWNLEVLVSYVVETFQEFKDNYSVFTDKKTGPLRQRVAELHTAVIDLAARIRKGDINHTWLPKHAFTVLSQIQNHAATLLEDLISDDESFEYDITAIENSLDSMIDTYEEIKEMIEKSLDNYRYSNITLVKHDAEPDFVWRTVQIGIGGTDVWRRMVLPQTIQLLDLHKLIQALFGWTGIYAHRFVFEYRANADFLDKNNCIKRHLTIADLAGNGFSEVAYEYGMCWTIKIIILAAYNAGKNESIRCVAGESAAPPEKLEGPLRFRRFITSFNSHNKEERKTARMHLGENFNSGFFDINECNAQIKHITSKLQQHFNSINSKGKI